MVRLSHRTCKREERHEEITLTLEGRKRKGVRIPVPRASEKTRNNVKCGVDNRVIVAPQCVKDTTSEPAVAMNDLCLVSVWRTRVRIAPPQEVQPQE